MLRSLPHNICLKNRFLLHTCYIYLTIRLKFDQPSFNLSIYITWDKELPIRNKKRITLWFLKLVYLLRTPPWERTSRNNNNRESHCNWYITPFCCSTSFEHSSTVCCRFRIRILRNSMLQQTCLQRRFSLKFLASVFLHSVIILEMLFFRACPKER